MNSQIKALDELRREHLLGPISGWAVLWGNYVILGVLLLFSFLVTTVKYPYVVSGSGEIRQNNLVSSTTRDNKNFTLFFKVKEEDYELIKIDQHVSMSLKFSVSNLNNKKILAKITAINLTNNQLLCIATPIQTDENIKLLSPGITGKVEVSVKNVTLVERILGH